MFILLVLLQVVVLNSISFFSFAIPIVYAYFILKLPVFLNRNITLLLGFILGFIVDIFCNTPGINAAATTFVALLRKPIIGVFVITDEYVDEEPAISTVGMASFMKYAVVLIFIHIATLVSLEAFSYFNLKLMLLKILSSTIISSVIIFGFEGFGITKKNSSWRKI